jgi:hypothetical protein
LLNFQHYGGWWSVHFTEADCRTLIGPTTRYNFATVESLCRFVIRFHPEDLAEFDRGVRSWGRGSNYVHLTPEQYSKLKSI